MMKVKRRIRVCFLKVLSNNVDPRLLHRKYLICDSTKLFHELRIFEMKNLLKNGELAVAEFRKNRKNLPQILLHQFMDQYFWVIVFSSYCNENLKKLLTLLMNKHLIQGKGLSSLKQPIRNVKVKSPLSKKIISNFRRNMNFEVLFRMFRTKSLGIHHFLVSAVAASLPRKRLNIVMTFVISFLEALQTLNHIISLIAVIAFERFLSFWPARCWTDRTLGWVGDL